MFKYIKNKIESLELSTNKVLKFLLDLNPIDSKIIIDIWAVVKFIILICIIAGIGTGFLIGLLFLR